MATSGRLITSNARPAMTSETSSRSRWIVIGITGVTCGGKTTLATNLCTLLQQTCGNVVEMISQDDYFHPVEDERHTWMADLEHIHFDVITSLDMGKMCTDVVNMLKTEKCLEATDADATLTQCTQNQEQTMFVVCKQKVQRLKELIASHKLRVLIIEGFSIFDVTVASLLHPLCDLRYFFTLEHDECKERRLQRTYEPPDCDGYFDVAVWPEYVKYLKFAQEQNDIAFFHNDATANDAIVTVLDDLIGILRDRNIV